MKVTTILEDLTQHPLLKYKIPILKIRQSWKRLMYLYHRDTYTSQKDIFLLIIKSLVTTHVPSVGLKFQMQIHI